ncbi:MAG: hypothetical protein GY874_04000 [Desulfobacteraceae bacterium]|nr:hypothetical protein [Desulfobacteraceae bacterium]
MKEKIELLIEKGVTINNPQSVEIGDDIDVARICAKNVTLHAGSKLYGKNTFISEGARIGFEAPASIENCFIGPDVDLKGGFFSGAVFLKDASCGSGAHVREGTILEEQVSIAHTVGLKQTILFPFVTIGSLINFCDCFMAGGTDRKNHSEVGSSYIHFNFTPNQDKATPSLIGDVPKGVMLDQSPIFLGGQGGLVGPCRLAYGTVAAAGSICRKDQLAEDYLVIDTGGASGKIPYKQGRFGNVKRILVNNLHYIGNLAALMQWYNCVRRLFIGEQLPDPLFQGLIQTLDKAFQERLKQLGRLCEKMQMIQTATAVQQQFCQKWPEIEAFLQSYESFLQDDSNKEIFLEGINKTIQQNAKDYLMIIKRLPEELKNRGTRWLNSIVDRILDGAGGLIGLKNN